MNQYTLDKLLRTVTDSEREYLKGNFKDYGKVYKTREIDGRKVLYFSIEDLDPTALVTAKKHSRFQSFPEHCHSCIELNYMYSGQCVQHINGKRYVLQEGQTLLLNYDTVHRIQPLGQDDIMLVLNIRKDYLTGNFFDRFSAESIVTSFFLDSLNDQVAHQDFLIFQSQHSRRLHTFIREFMCEWYSPSIVSADIISSLLTLILSEIINVYKSDMDHRDNAPQHRLIAAVLHHIETHYETCTLTDTAARFGLNSNYLSNLLKKHTGSSYWDLVTSQRIHVAKRLLRNTAMSVTDISNKVGYQNISFFYQKFQQQVGCLPGEYRQVQASTPAP
ncbi:MAG TPA: helix-turn-helix domain-containing protein [Candidatus Faecousia excrementipullorum]|nr:helix-turn-helix domain-containing protein [Candidatus Faecousia excrementipullorum]